MKVLTEENILKQFNLLAELTKYLSLLSPLLSFHLRAEAEGAMICQSG